MNRWTFTVISRPSVIVFHDSVDRWNYTLKKQRFPYLTGEVGCTLLNSGVLSARDLE